MKRDLAAMAAARWDVAVVGGGIYGVCAAWEAARRGLSVCLVERNDFASATSSQSLKVVHGGLRYLQHGDLARFREGVKERRGFLSLAPHLVQPLPFLIPTYGHALRSREVLALGLLVNDLLSLDRSPPGMPDKQVPRGRTLGRGAVLDALPALAERGVTGGALWYDCQTWNTERLLFAFLQGAVEAGAQVANQAEVVEFLGGPGRVEGVRVRDGESGAVHDVHAHVVLNATGPWVDGLLARLPSPPATRRFHVSKALNLLTRSLLGDRAVGLEGSAGFHDRDALLHKGTRLFFVVPWHGLSLLGTRHLPCAGDPDAFRVTGADVQLFLDEVNAAYPPFALRAEDVIGVYGGMLPQRAGSAGGAEVELEKRSQVIDHAREEGVDGLVSVVGVKWTAARAVAARAVSVAARKLGRRASPGRLAARLPGSEFARHDHWLAQARQAGASPLDPATAEHLLRSFGTRVGGLLDLARQRPMLAEAVQPGSPVIGAEIVHAVRSEMALHVDDVLLRRTELAIAPALGDAAILRVGQRMAEELGWDAARLELELARGQAALERFRRP